MSHNDTTVEASCTVSSTQGADSGRMYVPAFVQRELDIIIGTDLEITLSDLDHEFIDSVSFENQQVAGDCVTVPAEIMRQAGIEPGQVTAHISLVESQPGSELGQSEGAEAESESESSLDEIFGGEESEMTEESESEDEEEKGLSELFG